MIGALAPIMAVVLVAYLIIGLAMPVLPLYVHQQLGLSTFMVGIAAGVQFAAALLSRFWAGTYADTRGAKRAMVVGLSMGAASGLLYLLSLRVAHTPSTSILVLLIGRVFLGGAESFVITGALSHGLALGGPRNAGKVIAWVGTALWAAYGAGAPVGTLLYDRFGFVSTALATTALPLVALLVVAPLRSLPPSARERPSIRRVLGAVAVPGLGMALTAVGFGAISTFASLLFAERGWDAAWVAFTVLSATFILGRVVFGHLPDRVGGARIALVCALIEAAGLALIWLAPTAAVVFVGAAVTGVGYSLVYPGFGLEAVSLAPPEAKGLAMGAFTAFLDLSLGIASPALGLIAGRAGLGSVFLVSSVVTLGAVPVARRLQRGPAHAAHPMRPSPS
ncbi:major facilitator superfamily MFS_1 [Gemmatirosa kalamazoonensis]|uniref:Major facilitator superfamily MFS_1 n=2 Tax=Gemmatirosa kalamazoonensis TaxID=861299 RepID=W0RHM1_9BACT|nr:major facilitator superfamily MFS_1 [Gemmatirosa kalamazoonensis]